MVVRSMSGRIIAAMATAPLPSDRVANTIVVFGATGDLAHRKLYPALASLAAHDQLPESLTVIGVARTVRQSVEKADGDRAAERLAALERLGVGFRYVVGNADQASTYSTLRDR